MKKTILVILMVVMIATPCFAQEIEPDGIFSIEGTQWQALPIALVIFPFPWIYSCGEVNFGFYDGKVYVGLEEYWDVYQEPFFLDFLVFSIFITGYPYQKTHQGLTPLQTAPGGD